MKKSRIILNAFAMASLILAGIVSADELNMTGYLIDTRGHLVKNGNNGCWRTGYWTPALAIAECDPELVRKEEPKAAEAQEPVVAPAAPAPAPAPAPVVVPPQPPAFIPITLQTETLFGFDKSVIRPNGKKILDDEVVAKVKEYSHVGLILVTGYTDRIGTDAYNLKLSKRRADAVKAYLVDQGIEDQHIETFAKGKSDPIVSCDNVKGKVSRKNRKLVECLQPNRRVVVEAKIQKPAN